MSRKAIINVLSISLTLAMTVNFLTALLPRSIYAQDINNSSTTTNLAPRQWSDPSNGCTSTYKCIINSTDGLNDNRSLQISTNSTNKDKWLSLYGKPIPVMTNERYEIITHMKLNKFATGSHILILGTGTTPTSVIRILCPSATNGPLAWHEFRCTVTIPSNIIAMTPILAIGWSSHANEKAITSFDAIRIMKLDGGGPPSTEPRTNTTAPPSTEPRTNTMAPPFF
jgi:hypothetical protein